MVLNKEDEKFIKRFKRAVDYLNLEPRVVKDLIIIIESILKDYELEPW
jgi:hypothetical protein